MPNPNPTAVAGRTVAFTPVAGAQGFKVTAPVITQWSNRMKERGDFITLAGACSILKEAARQIVEQSREPAGEQWLDIPAFLQRQA